jgi:hypothetical protein
MIDMPKTWILYKTETGDAHGWLDRMLMPSEELTDILHQESCYSGNIPSVGDRVYDSKQEDDGTVYSRDGDWVVSKVHQFSSFDTDERLVVCYCTYAPITPEWEVVERGASVAEMMATKAHH